MRRTLRVVIFILLLATVAKAQDNSDQIQLRATVQSVVPLTDFSGQVTPVDADPRFALTLRIESVNPIARNFPVGGVVTLAIHSSTLLFVGEPTRGKTYDFLVHRTVQNGNVRFLGLIVDSGMSQFEGKWQARISPASGKHSITVNIVVKEGKIAGTVVLVDGFDGTETESPIINPDLSGRTLKFETNVKDAMFSWELTLPPPCHIGKGGLHANEDGIPGTNWNALWDNFMTASPGATASEVLDFLNQLKNRFRRQLDCK